MVSALLVTYMCCDKVQRNRDLDRICLAQFLINNWILPVKEHFLLLLLYLLHNFSHIFLWFLCYFWFSSITFKEEKWNYLKLSWTLFYQFFLLTFKEKGRHSAPYRDWGGSTYLYLSCLENHTLLCLTLDCLKWRVFQMAQM